MLYHYTSREAVEVCLERDVGKLQSKHSYLLAVLKITRILALFLQMCLSL